MDLFTFLLIFYLQASLLESCIAHCSTKIFDKMDYNNDKVTFYVMKN